MDKREARALLKQELSQFRAKTYEELAQLIGGETYVLPEIRTETGNCYWLEVNVFWDNKPGGDVRVIGSIGDGGLRAFFPLSDDFIKSPSGVFVGE